MNVSILEQDVLIQIHIYIHVFVVEQGWVEAKIISTTFAWQEGYDYSRILLSVSHGFQKNAPLVIVTMVACVYLARAAVSPVKKHGHRSFTWRTASSTWVKELISCHSTSY